MQPWWAFKKIKNILPTPIYNIIVNLNVYDGCKSDYIVEMSFI